MGKINQPKKKIYIDILMYCFLHYIAYVWITDSVNLVAYFCGLKQNNFVCNMIAIVVTVLIICFDCKKVVFTKFDYKCLWGVGVIMLLSAYYCVFADTSHDTVTYHVLNQNPVWYGEESFVLIETMFPLPDRMMYLFRVFLGYRAGTIFNSLMLSLTYIQIVKLLKQVFLQGSKKFLNPYIIGFCSIMLEVVLMDIGTYMTDLVGIPLVIELVICILQCEENETDTSQMVYFVVCLACLFLMKLTTIIYIVPVLLIYLYRARKCISVKRFVICLLCGIVIILPYMMYNFYLTGEIFYPYSLGGNTKYYALFHDERWGAENFTEMLIWPFRMITEPQYRKNELILMPVFYPMMGILTAFFLVINKIRKKKIDIYSSTICIIAISSLYEWIVMRAVYRYAIASFILCGLALVCYVYYKSCAKWVNFFVVSLFVIQMSCSLYSVVVCNTNWKYSTHLTTALKNPHIYLEQLNMVGEDRGEILGAKDEYQHFVSFGKPYLSLGYLLNSDAQIYELWRFERIPEEAITEWYDELNALQSQGVKFYSASLANDFQEVVRLATTYGFIIDEVEYINNTYLGKNLVIYHLTLQENALNALVSLNSKSPKEIAVLEPGNKVTLSGSIMVSPVITWTSEPSVIQYYTILNGNKQVISSQKIYPGEPTSLDINFDLSNYSETLVIYAESSSNWSLDWDAVYFLNVSQQLYIEEECIALESVFYSFIDEYPNAEKIGEKEREDCLNGKNVCIFENKENGKKAIYITPHVSIRYTLELDDKSRVLEFDYGYYEAAKNWGSNGANITIKINDEVVDEIFVNPENSLEVYSMSLAAYQNERIIVDFICYPLGDAIGDWILLYSPICK
ncbi:MAG: hypothetical protein J6K15_00380 [Lachnospiraceae bacterium]|nr:hypothetical protein [Lachnospiraceae bacterium]